MKIPDVIMLYSAVLSKRIPLKSTIRLCADIAFHAGSAGLWYLDWYLLRSITPDI